MQEMRKTTGSGAALALTAVLAGATAAAGARPGVSVDEQGVANGGYDVVAYFTSGKAVPGSAELAAEHDGATYHFATADNRSAFRAAPDRYLPRYGGYCAFAVAMKKAKVKPDPKTFRVSEGQLYLFFNDLYEGEPFDTSVPWDQDAKRLRPLADTNWKQMEGR